MEWFLEPRVRDDSWGHRGEPPFSWLTRSTLPRASAAREFLNRNLAQLPEQSQPQVFAALRNRWQSAFFELIVARTLQLLGASITVEPPSAKGTRIDFVARFPDGILNVEAVSPLVDGAAGKTVQERSPLLDIIERLVPNGWGVGVVELPTIGPNESKRIFREAVEQLFDSVPPQREVVDLIKEVPQGRLHIRLWTDPPGGSQIVFEPPITSWNNTEERIRLAIKRKKHQARATEEGASVVAIHAGGISSKFEDFDLALFGRSVMVLNHSRIVTGHRLKPDGVFAARRREPPVLSGVLAFIRVGFRTFPDPIFYPHPRSTEVLPTALDGLQQRVFMPDT